jgi:hypothetical protein
VSLCCARDVGTFGSCNRALLKRQLLQLRRVPGRTSVLLFVSLVAWAHFICCSWATSPADLVDGHTCGLIALALGVDDQARLALLGRKLHSILAAGQLLAWFQPFVWWVRSYCSGSLWAPARSS